MTKPLSHYFLCAAIALVALVATSAFFHALLPPSIPEGVAEKLRFFAEHKDEFDTIFLGSSRFYYAVSPESFDQITRENGVPTRTFNFGIDGMNPPENFYVLEQILKTEPRSLKWVFLEVADVVVHREWLRLTGPRPQAHSLMRWLAWPLTVYRVCLAWIFFRAVDLEHAFPALRSFVLFQSPGTEDLGAWMLWIVLALAVVHWLNSRGTFANWWRRGSDRVFAAGYGCTAAIVLLFIPPHYTPFIYFQF